MLRKDIEAFEITFAHDLGHRIRTDIFSSQNVFNVNDMELLKFI